MNKRTPLAIDLRNAELRWNEDRRTILRLKRHEAEMGQKEFNELAGQSKYFANNVEYGRRKVTMLVIYIYAKVLGLEVQDLVPTSDGMTWIFE